MADGGWGQFVYTRQRICAVRHKLLKKLGSGHQIKITKRDAGRKAQESILK